jgi:hypothetical protein
VSYQPEDSVPGRPPQPYRGPYQEPPYGYPPPQVVVNVVQQAGPVYVRRRGLNNRLHFWLTFWTGGAWGLFVWIPLAISRARRR